MTQEERIKKLEQEVSNLREELKKNRKANVWKKVKDKHKEEFKSFDWIDIFNTTDSNERPVTFKHYMNEEHHTAQAIGTLIRITLKRKGINYFEESDIPRIEKMTKEILEIMKNERIENK